MLELEAMGLDRVRTELSAQYVDHNLIQADFRNPDDHLFLRSACRRFGVWYSRAGNGVSHPVHMERFGVPGKTLLGADSHTPAAGSLGMLAIGAGGLEVALAMAGEPFHLTMPRILGVRLVGRLPEWVSAKDVILEMLRRHGVDGGIGRIIEYHGPGLDVPVRDGPPRHRQHGRRAGRHHHGLSCRRRRPALPRGAGPRRKPSSRSSPTATPPTTRKRRSISLGSSRWSPSPRARATS